MVIMVLAVTLLTVATAAVMPLWSTAMQREKEEELIFRGLQYAEAVRIFQARNGRYPVRLEELIEVKPRCIRQLYTNPMSEDGEWELVFANGGQPGRPAGPNGGPNGPPSPPGTDPNGRPQEPADGNGLIKPNDETNNGLKESEGAFGGPAVGGQRQRTGPIIGVYAKGDEPSIKVFMGQQSYEQWVFTVDLIAGHLDLPDRPPLVPSAATLGRPYLDGIEPLVKIPTQGQPGQGAQPGRGGGQTGQPEAPGGGKPADPFGVPGGLPPSTGGQAGRSDS